MRGGKRKGAGRPKGARTVRSTKAAQQALASGRVTPLDVMLKAMHEAYNEQKWGEAAAFAKDAAPYMHPKLQSVMHTGDADKPVVTENHFVVEFVGNDGESSDT